MKHYLFWGLTTPVFTILFTAVTAMSPLSPPSATAIQYSDGTTEFSYPLRLTNARTTRNGVGERHPTYYISFSFPEAAEELLNQVVISLDEGRRDPAFSYRFDATQAVANTPEGDHVLPLGAVTQDPMTKALTIQFDPPVSPGAPITLALKPGRNPRFAGVY